MCASSLRGRIKRLEVGVPVLISTIDVLLTERLRRAHMRLGLSPDVVVYTSGLTPSERIHAAAQASGGGCHVR